MENLPALALIGYVGFWIFVGLALIYLIFQRLEKRRQETFEKRDN